MSPQYLTNIRNEKIISFPRKLLRDTDSPASIPGLALWLDASASDALYTTDAGPVTAVSSPLDISGCVGWWDASDASSISDTSGSVDQWSDKSGQGNHVTASTTARPTTGTRTLNGLNVLDFDGTNDVLALGGYTFSSIATSRAMSVFCVMASDDPNAVRRVVSLQRTGKNSNDTGVFIGRHTTSSGSIDFATGAGDSATNDQADKNLISIFTDTSSSAGLYGFTVSAASNAKAMFKSGAAQATTVRFGTMAASSFLSEGSGGHTIDIGASRNSGNTLAAFWDGYIAEIIVYNTALSTSDRARVEAYLAAKWGISGVHAPAVTASDPVGYWRDRSGNGRHATQSTAASRPAVGSLNERRALSFNGTENRVLQTPSFAVSQPYELFTVAKIDSGITGTIYHRPGSGPILDKEFSSGKYRILAVTSLFGPPADTAAHVFTAAHNGANSLFQMEGVPVASGDAGSQNITAGLRYGSTGSGSFLPGRICEHLVYSRALSTAERRKVERYLARRWGITLAPQVSNAEAQDWVNRVYAAGSTVSQPVANAVSAFVDGCQADGIWDAMKSVVLLAGADTLAGALAPLKGTAPTSYNFASGDYNKTSGLKGNASSAYLDTNRANTADPQNSKHLAVFVSDDSTDGGPVRGLLYAGDNGTAGSSGIGYRNSDGISLFQANNASAHVPTIASLAGLAGVTRSSGTGFVARYSGSNVSVTAASDSPAAGNLFAYRRNGTNYSSARLSFYSIGEAVDLALLDARVSALMTAIGVS